MWLWPMCHNISSYVYMRLSSFPTHLLLPFGSELFDSSVRLLLPTNLHSKALASYRYLVVILIQTQVEGEQTQKAFISFQHKYWQRGCRLTGTIFFFNVPAQSKALGCQSGNLGSYSLLHHWFFLWSGARYFIFPCLSFPSIKCIVKLYDLRNGQRYRIKGLPSEGCFTRLKPAWEVVDVLSPCMTRVISKSFYQHRGSEMLIWQSSTSNMQWTVHTWQEMLFLPQNPWVWHSPDTSRPSYAHENTLGLSHFCWVFHSAEKNQCLHAPTQGGSTAMLLLQLLSERQNIILPFWGSP